MVDSTDSARGPERFAEWFRKNYPGPDTIIHKPDWHAPKIYRAAIAAARADLAPDPLADPRVVALVEAAQWARNRLETIADENWRGDARDFKRSLVGVFADFDAALAALSPTGGKDE